MNPTMVPSNLMSKQITVRLPDEQVAFIDALVAAGDATSRADVVARALERERRRLVALRDVTILVGTQDESDLAEMARYSAGLPREHLD